MKFKMTDELKIEFSNMFEDEEDYEEELPPQPQPPEQQPETEEIEEPVQPEISEIDQLKAEVAALKAQKVKPVEIEAPVVEKPKSIVDEWKTKFKVDDLDAFGDAAELLTEIDNLRVALYEKDKTLSDLSSHPTVKQAKLEQQTIAEIQENSVDWQSEFLDMFDRSDEIKKLSDKKSKELGDFISSKVVPLMVQRKSEGKKVSNPLLALQREISAKLDEFSAPKKPAEPKPQQQPQLFQQTPKQQEQAAKKMMSLNPEGESTLAPNLPYRVGKEDAAYLQKHYNQIKHIFDFAEDI